MDSETARMLESLSDMTDGAEPEQLMAESGLPPSPFFDNPHTLLWHFAVNSRQREQLTIPREYWLMYARTLRRLLETTSSQSGSV